MFKCSFIVTFVMYCFQYSTISIIRIFSFITRINSLKLYWTNQNKHKNRRSICFPPSSNHGFEFERKNLLTFCKTIGVGDKKKISKLKFNNYKNYIVIHASNDVTIDTNIAHSESQLFHFNWMGFQEFLGPETIGWTWAQYSKNVNISSVSAFIESEN